MDYLEWVINWFSENGKVSSDEIRNHLDDNYFELGYIDSSEIIQRQHLTPFLRYHSAAAMSSVESRQNARFFNPLTAKMHKSCLVFLLTKPDAHFRIHRGDARE